MFMYLTKIRVIFYLIIEIGCEVSIPLFFQYIWEGRDGLFPLIFGLISLPNLLGPIQS